MAYRIVSSIDPTGNSNKAEEDLGATVAERSRYQTLYENLPCICFTLDSAGVVIAVNQFTCARLGYSPSELTKRPILRIFHSHDQLWLAALGESSSHQQYQWEGHLACKDGHSLWVKAIACAVPMPLACEPGSLSSNSFDTNTFEENLEREAGDRPRMSVTPASQPDNFFREMATEVELQKSSPSSFVPRVILLVCEDITLAKQIEQQHQESEKCRTRQSKALVELAKSKIHKQGDLKAALRDLTEVSARVLEIERVSVWSIDNDSSEMTCLHLYERSADNPLGGIEMKVGNYAAYFQVLKQEGAVAAPDAQGDPRMKETWLSYLSTFGITSRLDVPILVRGELAGILCYESIEDIRQWVPEEEDFARTSAEWISLAMEASERTQAEAARNEGQQLLLRQYQNRLEQEVEERIAELRRANQQLQDEIDKKTQTEVALRRQQEEQQVILDSIPAMIWYKDTENRCLRVNKAAAELGGMPREEIEGKYFYEIYPGMADEYYEDDLEVINSGKPKWEIIEQWPTGSSENCCWLKTNKIPYQDVRGNIVGVIVFAVDITEKVQVEEELRKYCDRFEELVAQKTSALLKANEQLQREITEPTLAEKALNREKNFFIKGPVTVFRWIASTNWPVDYVSQNVTQFGYQVSDFTSGKVLYASIVHPHDIERVAAEVKAYTQAGVHSFEQEYRIVRKDGENRWIYDFTAIARNDSGEITHYEGYILDITELTSGLNFSPKISATGLPFKERYFPSNSELKSQPGKEEIAHSISMLQAMQELTTDGIVAVSLRGEIVNFNQRFVEIWGIFDFIMASSAPARRLEFFSAQLKAPEAFLRRVLELYDQIEAIDYNIIELKDGRIFEVRSQPQRIDKKIIGRVWNFRDITTARQAQASLMASEARFRAIFDSWSQFAVLLQPDGTLLEANQKALKLGGFDRSDVAGRPFWECGWWLAPDYLTDLTDGLSVKLTDVPAKHSRKNIGDDRQDNNANALSLTAASIPLEQGKSKSAVRLSRIQEQLQAAIAIAAAGQLVREEVKIVTEQGKVVTLDFAIKPLFDENRQVVLLIVEDGFLAESQTEEGALQESEERYSSAIAAMAEGIIIHNANGTIRACNAAAERILGLSADPSEKSTARDPYWRTIREDGSPFVLEDQPISVTLRTGQSCENVVMGIEKSEGAITWISVNSHPLFGINGTKPHAAVVSLTDITERKSLEIALRQQAERERLIGAIAQRIRQSLNLQATLHTTVGEVRQLLQADRTLVFRLLPNGDGVVAVESVNSDWPAIVGTNLDESCFPASYAELYKKGRIRAIEDIHNAGLDQCHIDLLASFQVRANLVVPILQNNPYSADLRPEEVGGAQFTNREGGRRTELWGLLIAHQCSGIRRWQSWEEELLKQLTEQLAIAIQQAQLYHHLEVANQELQRLATSDGLTLLANRRRFDEYLEQQWRQLGQVAPMSLILCDLDFFKAYNDTYGHQAGDACLQQVAGAIREAVNRPGHLVARYGGEEFAVILPNTDIEDAVRVAEEIQGRVRGLGIAHRSSQISPVVTLSLGVSSVVPGHNPSPAMLIAAADEALYLAKDVGRDAIALAPVQTTTRSP